VTRSSRPSVIELRVRERRGQNWIGPELGVPARTVSRILCRHDLPYLTELDRMTGEKIRSSKMTAVRYERTHPGELVHMDVKKLGKIPVGGGWRAEGGTRINHRSRPTEQKKNPIGYDYVHSLVDDYSRLAYSEVLPDEKGTTCAGFLAWAAAYFADHGISRIERVMTDNAWAYKHSIRGVVAELAAQQKFIKPRCPWQNGKVGRFNRTLATEWAYRRPFTSSAERTAALAPWIETYNTSKTSPRTRRPPAHQPTATNVMAGYN
jgi:transposase InsO family protein